MTDPIAENINGVRLIDIFPNGIIIHSNGDIETPTLSREGAEPHELNPACPECHGRNDIVSTVTDIDGDKEVAN